MTPVQTVGGLFRMSVALTVYVCVYMYVYVHTQIVHSIC